VEVKDVTVDGDTAVVTFSTQQQGRSSGDQSGRLRRIDGRWRVLGNG
jgi:hypothetical protein